MTDLTEFAHQQMPFTALLGLEVEMGTAEVVRARGRWAEEHCTAGGTIHGGYLMGLADSAAAMCAYFNLPEGATTSTIESKTNFLRPVSAGEIRIEARPVNVGRSVIVVQTDISDEQDRLVSRTTQSQMVMRPS